MPTVKIIGPERQLLVEPASGLVPGTSNNDPECIDLWLHGRPALTPSAYRADVASFRRSAPLPLRQVALADQHR